MTPVPAVAILEAAKQTRSEDYGCQDVVSGVVECS
jgi:hypothetical protein